MSIEQEAMSQLRREMERGAPVGKVIVVCPKCNKKTREYQTKVTALTRWAFSFWEDGLRCVEMDGRGCCF